MILEQAYWRVRVDCWYEPHRKMGAKPTLNKRDVRTVIVGPCDMYEAEKQAVKWAEDNAPIGFARKWLGFEFVSASKVTFPLEITHTY